MDGLKEELFDRGLFKEAVAFDASDALLQLAEAKREERRIYYRKADTNVGAIEGTQNLNRILSLIMLILSERL